MKLSTVFIGLLLSTAIVHSAFAVMRIRDDMGGPLGAYLRMFTAVRESGERAGRKAVAVNYDPLA